MMKVIIRFTEIKDAFEDYKKIFTEAGIIIVSNKKNLNI